jgi:hypothetical protein
VAVEAEAPVVAKAIEVAAVEEVNRIWTDMQEEATEEDLVKVEKHMTNLLIRENIKIKDKVAKINTEEVIEEAEVDSVEVKDKAKTEPNQSMLQRTHTTTSISMAHTQRFKRLK